MDLNSNLGLQVKVVMDEMIHSWLVLGTFTFQAFEGKLS
jgi:hypothetical protein